MDRRTLKQSAAFTAIGALTVSAALLFGSTQTAIAVRPSAPADCEAVPAEGGVFVTWQAPLASDSPVYRYVVNVKGDQDSSVQLSVPKGTENPQREYLYTGDTTGGTDPLTMRVRAVNNTGYGDWCSAVVGADEPEPTTPPVTTAPSTEPTTEPPTTDPSPTATVTTPPPSGRPFIPYSGDPFLTDRVTNEPIDAGLTSQFRSFMASFPDQAGTPAPKLNGIAGQPGANWGTTFDLGQANEPLWTSGKCNQSFHARASLGEDVTGTSDSPLMVIDQASGKTVFFTNVSYAGGTSLTVGGSCAVMYHSSNGLDGDNPRSNDDRNQTSRGRISEMLAIRKDLFDFARANNTADGLGHGLHFFIAESKTDQLPGSGVHPMTGEESSKNGFGEEGTRIAVAQNATLGTCTAEAMVLVKTLQTYGAVIGDNAGGASTLKVGIEPDPISGLQSTELNGCIDWNDWVVITPGSQVSP